MTRSTDALRPMEPHLYKAIRRLIDGLPKGKDKVLVVVVLHDGENEFAIRSNLDELSETIRLLHAAIDSVQRP